MLRRHGLRVRLENAEVMWQRRKELNIHTWMESKLDNETALCAWVERYVAMVIRRIAAGTNAWGYVEV